MGGRLKRRERAYGPIALILQTRCLHPQTHTHLTPLGIFKSFGPYETDGIVHVSPSLPSTTDPASDSKHSGSRPELL